jgi:hypothetical protein
MIADIASENAYLGVLAAGLQRRKAKFSAAFTIR